MMDIKRELDQARIRISELRGSLDLEGKKAQIEDLEKKMAEPGFWDDPEAAQKIGQKVTALKDKLVSFNKLVQSYEDIQVMYELGQEEEEYLEEAEEALLELGRKLDEHELELLFKDKYDSNNVILSLHSGAGGTESQDWTEMLLRMYTRWAERRGFGVEMLDYLPGDEAGVKSVTLLIKGEYAYGYLKAEKGVHRLVRISPFDASGRRHTSFAAVDTLPEIEESDNSLELNPAELKIDTYRAGGAGGQHVNKTDSAVRITHIPTGIVVQCQSERSQNSNRLAAEKVLKAKLFELKRQEQENEMASIRGEQREIAWGSQIRSYVFHPYSMVKDHRTNVELGNVNAVMDGELDSFIDAYLRQQAAQE
ncbi:MAG: peptide chain release factor 2 [Peptococcia bacterium]